MTLACWWIPQQWDRRFTSFIWLHLSQSCGCELFVMSQRATAPLRRWWQHQPSEPFVWPSATSSWPLCFQGFFNIHLFSVHQIGAREHQVIPKDHVSSLQACLKNSIFLFYKSDNFIRRLIAWIKDVLCLFPPSSCSLRSFFQTKCFIYLFYWLTLPNIHFYPTLWSRCWKLLRTH